jgi:hypothetical protein
LTPTTRGPGRECLGSRRLGSRGLAQLAFAVACALAVGCVSGSDEQGGADPTAGAVLYEPDRRDYMAFREAWPDLLEPNYLPFMVHRKPADPVTGDVLLFCRWPAEAMPLSVYVEATVIPEALQNEFDPVDPAIFTEALVRTIGIWESELEGLVAFELVTDPSRAQLRLRVLGERAPSPEPEVRVLGVTEAVRRACEPHGWDPNSERMNVSFTVPEAVIYGADEFGLLTPAQVEAIALHEIGHALGMLGHQLTT